MWIAVGDVLDVVRVSRSVCFPNISIENGSFPISQLPSNHHAQQPAPDPLVAIRCQLIGMASDALSRNFISKK